MKKIVFTATVFAFSCLTIRANSQEVEYLEQLNSTSDISDFEGLNFQMSSLPKFSSGDSYKSVRNKMLKLGWTPYSLPTSEGCPDYLYSVCGHLPETDSCSGSGVGNCRFLWKKRGKVVVIITAGNPKMFQSIFNM